MKRTHLFGTMMACTLAAAVAVGAQEPQPTTSQTARDAKSVVVTGCLKSDPSAAATTGTAGATGTAGSTASIRDNFVLTDAKVSGGSGSSATTGATNPATPTTTPTTTTPTTSPTTPTTSPTGSTAGTSGSSSADTKTFSLVGGSPSDLQQYVNSQVEITGTLDQSATRSAAGASGAGSTAGGTGSTASGAGSTMAGMAHNQQLRVTSVRQVASSCSGQ